VLNVTLKEKGQIVLICGKAKPAQDDQQEGQTVHSETSPLQQVDKKANSPQWDQSTTTSWQ